MRANAVSLGSHEVRLGNYFNVTLDPRFLAVRCPENLRGFLSVEPVPDFLYRSIDPTFGPELGY